VADVFLALLVYAMPETILLRLGGRDLYDTKYLTTSKINLFIVGAY